MKRLTTPLLLACLLASSLLVCPQKACAQAIQWRYDYAKARQEAEREGKPLILDFGTKHCTWCVKLEAETLNVPTISRIINERFIPLKIDADEQPILTQKLYVTSYPTVILADSDGRILGTMEGYKEAPAFQEILQRALARVANPEWMIRDYQTASKALAVPDYPRALALLKHITEDGKARPIQVKARQLFDQIEKQAEGLLARARRHIDGGQTQEATEVLAQLVRSYPGTSASTRAGTWLTAIARSDEAQTKRNREQRAQELLAQAKEDYRVGQILCCLDRCKTLLENYRDLEEAVEAQQLNESIKANPTEMEQACTQLSKRLRDMHMELAEVYMRKGDRQQAMVSLQRVVENFPGTTEAEVAETRLGELRGEPMRAVNFNNR